MSQRNGTGTDSSEFDPLHPPAGDRRFAFLRHARVENPVLVSTRKAGRVVFLFTYRDIQSILLDHATWENVPYPDGALSMLLANPPDHRRLRAAASRTFAPRAVERLATRIEAISSSLVEEAVGRLEIDLVRDLAWRLPELVMMEMLGLPRSDRAQFTRWTMQMGARSQSFLLLSDEPSLDTGFLQGLGSTMGEMREYFLTLVDGREAQGDSNLLTHIVQNSQAGGRLTREEAVNLLILLIIAGQDAVSLLIANTIVILARNPSAEKRLRTEPALLPIAVEEALRFAPPFRWTAVRRATEPLVLGGVNIAPGDLAILWLESANLDETVFENSEIFSLSRANNPHISFGAGIHFCLGAHLARLEARAMVGTLLRRTSRIELSSIGTPHPNAQFNGPRSLPGRLLRS